MRTWTIWTLISISLYAVLVQLGQYPPGFRHSVFLLTALVPLMAAICTHLSKQPVGRIFSIFLVGATLAASLASLPNISIRNQVYAQEEWPWPETNYEIRPTMEHWLSHRQAEEPIYVYYAGNSVFRYYLQALGVEKIRPPHDWASTAASNDPQEPLYVAYGKWLRDRPAGELAQDVLDSLPDAGRPFWIFFLGRRTLEEIERTRTVIGPEVPILGFYSNGEYCRIRCGGPSYLHNETATVSVIGV